MALSIKDSCICQKLRENAARAKEKAKAKAEAQANENADSTNPNHAAVGPGDGPTDDVFDPGLIDALYESMMAAEDGANDDAIDATVGPDVDDDLLMGKAEHMHGKIVAGKKTTKEHKAALDNIKEHIRDELGDFELLDGEVEHEALLQHELEVSAGLRPPDEPERGEPPGVPEGPESDDDESN
eukprot:2384069-Pyramimonas_sp.AAC.1